MVREIGIITISLLLVWMLSRFKPISGWLWSFKRWPLISLSVSLLFFALFLTPTKLMSATQLSPIRLVRIAVLLFVCVLSFYKILQRFNHISRSVKSLWAMFLYSIVAMASYFYSNDPILSLWKGFEVFTVVLVFIWCSTYIKSITDVYIFLNIQWLILLFLVTTALVGGLLDPSTAYIYQTGGLGGAHAYAFRGIFPAIHSNTLAQFGAIVALVALNYLIGQKGFQSYSRPIMLVTLMFGLVAMFLSHSRTSLLAFLIAAVVYGMLSKHKMLAIFMAVFGISLFFAVPSMLQYLEGYVVRGQTADAFVTLSGRMYFWPKAIDAFMRDPIFGQGFYSGHRDFLLGTDKKLEGVSSVDNTYLEVLVDLGLIGIFFIGMAVLGVVALIIKTRPKKIDRNARLLWCRNWNIILAVYITILVRSLTGPTIQVFHPNLIIFLFLVVSLSCVNYIRKEGGRK